ncbi:hypothetical protein H4R24_001079 [Coemansia sp. RSA 988]|nr:hypothetical protein H4R24_001079 [Coemansia sp. RSA 988]
MCRLLLDIVYRTSAGDSNGNSRNTGHRLGLRRSLSTQFSTKPGERQFIDLCGRIRRQNQSYRGQNRGLDKEFTVPAEEFSVGNCHIDTGKGLELSFGYSPPVIKKRSMSDQRVPTVDITSTPLGPLFVRRPEPRSEKARYGTSGYPMLTRSVKGNSTRDTTRGAGRQRQKQQTQPKLKGFETRVINTHIGKTTVRTPVMTSSTVGADEDEQVDIPELPPPSVAELRYNAQRALISAPPTPRTSASARASIFQQGAAAGRKVATVRVYPRGGAQRNITRALSARTPTIGAAVATTSVSARGGSGFRINMQFGSEQSESGDAINFPTIGSTSTCIDINSSACQKGFVAAVLEQGRASLAGSVLEQWGIPTPTKQPASGAQRPGQGSIEDESDSATEDATLGALGPDIRGQSVVLSDESHKLIDSIFSGRLSIDNHSGGTQHTRFSRSEGSASTFAVDCSGAARSNTAAMGSTQGDISQYEPSTPRTRPRLGSAWTQPSQSPQLRAQEPGERDGSKMRKPSFWSIFRGGSARKDQGDDKKDVGSDSFSVSGRTHGLRKQQSTSSGFAESIGFSKRLNNNESKFSTIVSGHHLFTNKALPTVPPVRSPQLLSSLPQPQHPPQILNGVTGASDLTSSRIVGSAAGADFPQTTMMMTRPATARPSTASASLRSERATGMSFAPDSSAASSHSGLRAANGKAHNQSLESQALNTHRSSEGTRMSKYSSPMDEYFSLSSADEPPNAGDGDSIEQASEQGCTAAESPVLTSSALKYDSAAAEAAAQDSDDDSDIVPLSQSRVLVEAGAREELSARLAAEGHHDLESTVDDNASDVKTEVATAAVTAANEAKHPGIPAPINTRAVAATTADAESAGSALCISPNNPVRLFAEGRAEGYGSEAATGVEESSAPTDDGQEAAEPTTGASDNALLAREMGRYLYDVEEYHCRVSSGHGAGTVEPERPAVLQGIEAPELVSHAEWLGKREVFNALTLRHYIEQYDFGGQRIDECLRRLCAHIFLRGESQVIDRLLVALAQRFVECNADTRLLSADVAHAVTYSTLLLNTDLHIADIRASERMTRSRFVRNTVDTITQFQHAATPRSPTTDADDAAPWSPPPQLPELELPKRSLDAAASDEADARVGEAATLRSLVGSMASLHAAPGTTASRSSRDVVRLMGGRGKRFSFFESSSGSGSNSGPGGSAAMGAASGVTSSPSSLRAFDRLRRKVSTSGAHVRSRSGTVSMDEGSRAAAGGMPNLAELTAILKEVYAGIRSRPLGQPAFARRGAAARQTSLEVDTGIALASARAPPLTALDCDSHSSTGTGSARPSSVRSVPLHSLQRERSTPSLGPARRVVGGDMRGDPARRSGASLLNFGVRASPSLGAAAFALMRSPVENQHMRSGVLVRKHLFERAGKKASHRAWRTCYVSVDRGAVAMYKMDGRHGAPPDGRELTDTSLQLGSVSLRHTMTHMLPPPGYSRSRPHAFALQLPSGGVYLFQTASEVELRDWVAACNYWAARESKAPYMVGGVYNMEYGWDNTGDFALRFDERERRAERGESLPPAEALADERRAADVRESSRHASIIEWTPPTNPMLRSDLDEPAQLKALLHHISYLEEELVAHKKVQGSIDERFAPKSQQFHRAFSNWERKAQYILQELIKYQSYADVLQVALKQMHDDATPPIPEEPAVESPSATYEHRATPVVEAASPQPDASRASLPHGTSSTGRSSNSGLHTPSKSLPIKELLAPAAEKPRHRISIPAGSPQPPPSANASTTALATQPDAS